MLFFQPFCPLPILFSNSPFSKNIHKIYFYRCFCFYLSLSFSLTFLLFLLLFPCLLYWNLSSLFPTSFFLSFFLSFYSSSIYPFLIPLSFFSAFSAVLTCTRPILADISYWLLLLAILKKVLFLFLWNFFLFSRQASTSGNFPNQLAISTDQYPTRQHRY